MAEHVRPTHVFIHMSMHTLSMHVPTLASTHASTRTRSYVLRTRTARREVELEVLHCPGHTPGHVVFHHRASQLAIVGDVLFQGSIGRTDFPRGDYDTLIRSIREELLPLGDQVTVLPGHGPTTTLGRERRENPFLVDPGGMRDLV